MATLIPVKSHVLDASLISVKVKEETSKGVLSRFFAWYRNAVLSPTTEAEKAEWQKTSF